MLVWCKIQTTTANRLLLATFLMALGSIASCGTDESQSEATSAESPTSTEQPAVSSTKSSMVTSELSPLEVGRAWLDAYQLGDVERYQALTHPDATAVCLQCGYERAEAPYFAPIGEATSDVTDSRMLAIANGSIDPECSAVGRVVTCETLRTSDFGFFSDDGQPTQQLAAAFEFTVEDGLVTRRVITIHSGRVSDRAAVAEYQSWLKRNHPTAENELFAFSTILLTTAEQFEQHRQYVAEFLADR